MTASASSVRSRTRRPRRTPAVAIVAAMLVWVALAACGGSGSGYQAPSQLASLTPSVIATGNATVNVANLAFSPRIVSIPVGATVTWTFPDPVAHNVTADDGSFASATLSGGQTYAKTFDKAGTYAYHCTIHPSMIATVIVR